MRADDSIRVVHVATDPTSFSFLRGQARFMAERGVVLHGIASPGEYLRTFSAAENVPTDAVNMPRRITPLRDLVAVAQLVRRLRRLRPHIVHSHTPKGGLLGMIAAWLARTPVRIYHMRGLPMLSAQGRKRLLLRTTERLACALSHRVLCVSHSVRDIAIAEGLASASKLRVLAEGSGNGVDARGRFDPGQLPSEARARTREQLGIPLEAFVIGFIGRLVRDKGVVELAEAWQTVRELRPDAHLILVGPFEPQDPVPSEVRAALERDERVHLTGVVWDTPPLYSAMDVVALPTYREGFPNVVLEASAMERPVVATRVPGCIDAVVDGVTGRLVPPYAGEALAAALLDYAGTPGERDAHGRAGRARVLASFTPQVIWQELHREYSVLVRERLGVDAAPVSNAQLNRRAT
jgi:glycosyltransferase involved in cell wall biosynthesis